jgi:hypothetical protein
MLLLLLELVGDEVDEQLEEFLGILLFVDLKGGTLTVEFSTEFSWFEDTWVLSSSVGECGGGRTAVRAAAHEGEEGGRVWVGG